MQNMEIRRALFDVLMDAITPGKVLLLYGPRRVGKTWLLERVAEKAMDNGETVTMLAGEDHMVQEALSRQVVAQLRSFVGKASLLIIDEAQAIPNIGLVLKLLVDHLPQLKIIASGSASFDLLRAVGEPLTGRQKTFHLFPVWVQEEIDNFGMLHHSSLLERGMIFGSYPEVLTIGSEEEQQSYLHELVNSYLFKDILALVNLRNARKLRDLLILLAFQIGHEVSLSELGNQLELHKNTVFKYLDLLEKTFVIRNIRGFSRNLRKEVTKTSRYYFYDNGIRNALINNFNPLKQRDDVGMLWENYLVAERLKMQGYEGLLSNNYFWRTYDRKELDWVEERGGKLFGYEFKYRERKMKAPRGWLETYDNAQFQVVHQGNYLDFVAPNRDS